MKKKVIILFLLLISLISIKLSKEDIFNSKIINKNNTDIVGKIIIKKINLQNNLYDINSILNTIEKNVTILKESIPPNKQNSLLIIAAHSGTGNIAYFQELDKLDINDDITIIYKKKKYNYIVKDIWEEKKTGYIHINREKTKQLVLTTCSPTKDNYQLIVNCIEKES